MYPEHKLVICNSYYILYTSALLLGNYMGRVYCHFCLYLVIHCVFPVAGGVAPAIGGVAPVIGGMVLAVGGV